MNMKFIISIFCCDLQYFFKYWIAILFHLLFGWWKNMNVTDTYTWLFEKSRRYISEYEKRVESVPYIFTYCWYYFIDFFVPSNIVANNNFFLYHFHGHVVEHKSQSNKEKRLKQSKYIKCWDWMQSTFCCNAIKRWWWMFTYTICSTRADSKDFKTTHQWQK